MFPRAQPAKPDVCLPGVHNLQNRMRVYPDYRKTPKCEGVLSAKSIGQSSEKTASLLHQKIACRPAMVQANKRFLSTKR
jgi:hypothetical protein